MLEEKIFELIEQKREGTFWDFKEKYHDNKARLIHDIICLANNIENQDAYLIFGINDAGEVVGIEEDLNRRNQENFTTLIRDRKFAGNVSPYLIIKTIERNNHEIDVLIIKSTNKVPYYLEQEYKDGKSRLSSGSIYSRIEDRNTPINSTLDPLHTELLWKIRFGLLPIPIERLKGYLLQKKSWVMNSSRMEYYFQESPEFTIKEKENEEYLVNHRRVVPFFASNQINQSSRISYYECSYHNTVLFECEIVSLDGGRYLTPVPEFGDLYNYLNGAKSISYRYFIKESLLYNLHILMFDDESREAQSSRREFLKIIPVFDSKEEMQTFREWLELYLKDILDEINYQPVDEIIESFTDENEYERELKLNTNDMKLGMKLVEKLREYRRDSRGQD